MQVGNLAHSLKTPIAVLLNEARVLEKSHGELVRSQADHERVSLATPSAFTLSPSPSVALHSPQ